MTIFKKLSLKNFFEPMYFVIPLRAEQVSEANLRSQQGGINFPPFVLSLPYAKKKKKKKYIKISHMDGGQFKNVCLSVCLSVCCLSVTTSSTSIFCTVGLIGLKFFYKNQRKCVFENFYPEVQGSRPQGRFWCQINFSLQFLSNCYKKYIFSKINFSPGHYLG